MARTSTSQDLARSEICRGLAEAEVSQLFTLTEEVSLEAGWFLFPEGGPGDAVYLLVSGEVEVLKRDQGGHDRALAKLGAGSVLGEVSLLGSDSRRSASVRTIGACKLLKLPASAFQDLIRVGNVAALKVVLNLAKVMSKRLTAVDQRVVELLGKGDGGRREELGQFQNLLTHWSF